MKPQCAIVGCPVGTGAGQLGCQMGPEAYRTAGLIEALADIGCRVSDRGDVVPGRPPALDHSLNAKNLEQAVVWTRALETAAFDVLQSGDFPIFAGGDHSLSMGTVAGAARFAAS